MYGGYFFFLLSTHYFPLRLRFRMNQQRCANFKHVYMFNSSLKFMFQPPYTTRVLLGINHEIKRKTTIQKGGFFITQFITDLIFWSQTLDRQCQKVGLMESQTFRPQMNIIRLPCVTGLARNSFFVTCTCFI